MLFEVGNRQVGHAVANLTVPGIEIGDSTPKMRSNPNSLGVRSPILESVYGNHEGLIHRVGVFNGRGAKWFNFEINDFSGPHASRQD